MELPIERNLLIEIYICIDLYIVISFIDRPQTNYTHENQRNCNLKNTEATYTARLRKVRFNPIPGRRVEAVSVTIGIIKGTRREERVRRAVSWTYIVHTKNIISVCVLAKFMEIDD